MVDGFCTGVSVEMLRKVGEIENHQLRNGLRSLPCNYLMQKKLRISEHLFFSPYDDGSRREVGFSIDVGVVQGRQDQLLPTR